MSTVIGKDLFENCVAVLKATSMDRNDEDSWLEQVCILNEQSLGIGDTRYHHIGPRYELLHAVGYFPVDIVERR